MEKLEQSCICEPGTEGPVTVSISRKVKPGSESKYEQYLSQLTKAATEFDGHLGATILRPSASTNQEYVTIYRFASYHACLRWERSEIRSQLIKKLTDLVEGEPTTYRATGLEFWFTLPDIPTGNPTSPHKMAVVLIFIVYALVLGLNILLTPLLGFLPSPLIILVVVVLQVLLMTYLIMPKVTRLLKGWLFKN